MATEFCPLHYCCNQQQKEPAPVALVYTPIAEALVPVALSSYQLL